MFACTRADVGRVRARRDLKPENFLLYHKGDDAPLKATDFGLSVFYRPGQVLTDVVGSAYYVAPEVGCPSPLLWKAPCRACPPACIRQRMLLERFAAPPAHAGFRGRISSRRTSLLQPVRTHADFSGCGASPTHAAAAQVLRRRYGQEADIWSCGVILYILLSGVPPFWGETEQKIFEAVGKGVLDFHSDPWPHVSSEAKDCVRAMLQPVRHHHIPVALPRASLCQSSSQDVQSTPSLMAAAPAGSLPACRCDATWVPEISVTDGWRICRPPRKIQRVFVLRARQDPKKRATAEQILRHGWMRENGTASDKPLDNVILTRMRGFQVSFQPLQCRSRHQYSWMQDRGCYFPFPACAACLSASHRHALVQNARGPRSRFARAGVLWKSGLQSVSLFLAALAAGHESAEEGGAEGDRGRHEPRGDRRPARAIPGGGSAKPRHALELCSLNPAVQRPLRRLGKCCHNSGEPRLEAHPWVQAVSAHAVRACSMRAPATCTADRHGVMRSS